MEIKRNESTRNRPEGDRVLDAPYVFADLAGFITQLKEEKAWEKSDRNAITVFKSGDLTMVLSIMKEGAVVKDNTVDGLLTVQVLEGSLKMDTLEGDSGLGEKQVMVFHPGIPHSFEARMDTVILISTYDVKDNNFGNSPE